MKQKAHITFQLNGEQTEVAFAPHKTLLEVLREDLDLTGTKHGCELGECGTCAVLVDGRSILSCLMLGLDAEGREVKTIEGMAEGAELHPLQEQTFADLGAAQCGYCSPGFLLVAEELLKKNPKPSPPRFRKRCRAICVAAPATLRFTRQWSWPRRECVAKRWNCRERVFTVSSEICCEICG